MKFHFKNKSNSDGQGLPLTRQGETLTKGFTLVELLVTISMFVIITGVILVNSNKFDSTELLNNFAYDVALSIKQAQSYGVNVRESSQGAFDSYFGVFFNTDITPGAGGSKTNFVLFDYTPPVGQPTNYSAIYGVDITKSCSTSNACIQKYTMGRGTYIQSMCAGTVENCVPFNKLVVMFKRPGLDAKMLAFNGNEAPIPFPAYARITLSAASGATSTVVITSVGQIYVKK